MLHPISENVLGQYSELVGQGNAKWKFLTINFQTYCINLVIRDFASSPQWLYQWQLQWHVIISTDFYPIKPKFLWKICRYSLSVNTSQQIARSQKDYSSCAWGKIQCKFSRVSVTVTRKVTAVSSQSPY